MTAARRIAFIIFLLTVAAFATAQSRVTMSLGHSGPVRDVVGRSDLGLGFSVADDGKLVVWDLEHGGVRHSWQVSTGAVAAIALHPVRSEAVLFVEDGVATGRLVGFDWRDGSELFSIAVDARPTYLSYSPQGTYVVYTLPSFDSIYFVDADDGSPLRFLDDGFGSVSFVQMARSERNAMTYVPSRGEFIYWKLQNGSELQTISTLRRLDHLTLIDPQAQRSIAAADGDQLVVVDNLTGEVRATYPVAPIFDIAYDESNGRILVLSEQRDSRTILSFTYRSGRLRRDFFRPQNFSSTTTVFTAVGVESTQGYLGGDLDGQIAAYAHRNGRRSVIGPAVLTPIEDVALSPGRVHLSLGSEILSIVSDLFEPDRTDISATFFRDTRLPLADADALRLAADGERLLLWGAHEPGTIWEIAPPSSSLLPVYDDERDVPIADVKATESGPLAIRRDGTILHIGREEATERFRYTAVGTQDALWDPQLGLIAAKTRTSAFDTSIIVVDQLTRETVAADTDAFLTTRIALDHRSNTLYAIGLHGNQSSAQTRLTRLTGDGFNAGIVLERVPVELARGDLHWDTRTGSLFSTLDYRTLRRYRGRREQTFESTEHLHTDLSVGANLVIARNIDGSASVWNRSTGEHVVDVYVIGSEWVAISRVGTFIASSPRAESYLTFLPAEETRLSLEDFRVTAPFEID
ncbi:MAG: WD40 repeat domain-containing protein [Spirochaetota bacterium]